MTFDGKSVKRNNNEYLAIENAKLSFKVRRWVNTCQSGFLNVPGKKNNFIALFW